MEQPIIHAVLIDDDAEDIQQFIELAQLPPQVRLKTLRAKKSEGPEPFPEVMAYLTNPQNTINLLFCDIALDKSREADAVGVELVHRLEDHYRGRLPFAVAFVTGMASLFAVNMLVEMVSPTTLCGFAVKWQMPQPSRSFPDMIARILQNFQNKFVYRLKGGDGLAEPDFKENYTWFFKGYFDDYMNRSFRVDTLNGQMLRLPLRQIIAFERMGGRDAKSVIYFVPEVQNSIEQAEVDYYFEDLCTSLADLDFRPFDAKDMEDGERKSRSMAPSPDHPVVFARVATTFLLNLQHPTWSQLPSVLRNGEVKYANGNGTWLQSGLRLSNGQPLQVRTRPDCIWGRDYLKKWFTSLT